MIDYNSASSTLITSCVDPDALRDLTAPQREVVLLLMSRAAEKSYRRGFQQGSHIALQRPEDLPKQVCDWRYRLSTDQSPWGDCANVDTSIDRLMLENRDLVQMGLIPPPSDVSLFDLVISRQIARLAERMGAAIHDEDDYDSRLSLNEIVMLGHNLAAHGGLIAMVDAYEAAEQLHPNDYDLGMLAIADAWQDIGGWTLPNKPAVPDANVIYSALWPAA